MKRFLEYSRHHQKRIKAIFIEEEKISQQNIMIIDYDDESFTYISAKQKTPQKLPLEKLLTAMYARGDNGETE